MISDAYVHVTCDKCKYNIEVRLTACAGRAWDDRDLERELEMSGWFVDGDATLCEYCREDQEDEKEAV